MHRILVIDDEPACRNAVGAILEQRGYAIEGAATVAKGLEAALSRLPDLIVTDVNLTDGDGLSMLRTLRNNPKTATVPVVLMSGIFNLKRVREGMRLGADDFLEKPFKPEWLLETVNAQLRKREKIQMQADQTQTRLVAILEATPDLVAIVEASSDTLVYLNRAGRRLTGCSPDEDITGRPVTDFFDESFCQKQVAAHSLGRPEECFGAEKPKLRRSTGDGCRPGSSYRRMGRLMERLNSIQPWRMT